MDDRLVTVFGGSGFLGRRVAARLLDHGCGVRIAARHAAAPGEAGQRVAADINDESAVAAAIAGASGVVNAVSLYVERGSQTFHRLHVEAAARVARLAQAAGVERLVHVSGLGADARSRSSYIRARGEGELAVQAEFPAAVIVRPAVMFAEDDAFLTRLTGLLRWCPACPLFGSGHTRLQPVHVDDVAEAIARAFRPLAAAPASYELGGPRVYSYRELIAAISDRLGRQPPLIPVPFPVWHALARVAEMLPHAPLSRNQVELMEVDTVASGEVPGFGVLGITPRGLEETLARTLVRG